VGGQGVRAASAVGPWRGSRHWDLLPWLTPSAGSGERPAAGQGSPRPTCVGSSPGPPGKLRGAWAARAGAGVPWKG